MRVNAVVLAGLMLMPGAAWAAGPLESVYTDLDTSKCTTIEADDLGATLACPGYRGYPVVVAEGDLRMFVSFGVDPTHEPAAEQTLPPFNHVGTTLEWRIRRDGDDIVPVATILRWYTAPVDGSGADEGQVLVVTQLKLGATCQMALIDARAVKDANQRARDIADGAGDFDCAEAPQQVQPFNAY